MIQDLFAHLTSLVEGLAAWQQVLALVPIGAIPFIESYLGSFLGTVVGVHPAVAIPAAVIGNLLATLGATALAGRTRDAVTSRAGRRTEGGTTSPGAAPTGFRAKVARALDRFGVPGVCLLGPLVVPSQFTGPALVGLGATRTRVYLWMGLSITLWGVLFGVFGGVVATSVL